MASSLLRGLLLGAIASGKALSILAKQRNKLIFKIENSSDITVNFDMIKSWKYSNSIKLTENPVEQGVNINDHRIIEPMKLTIEVCLSNVINPLNTATVAQNIAYASKVLYMASGVPAAMSPMEATYSMLKTGMLNSEVFDIESPIGILKNFLITNIESTNDSSNYGAFEGTINIQEVLTYENTKINTNKSGIKPIQNTNGNVSSNPRS